MSMDSYFTPADEILENKLNIHDPAKLAEAESRITAVRNAEILAASPLAPLTFQYLRDIHRHLFSEIYAFAGKVRTVDVVKGDSVFCYVQFIDEEQQRIFSQLQQNFFSTPLARDAFVHHIAEHASNLNALHPFREGNGRAIRCFLTILAQRLGYAIHYHEVEKEALLHADIAAFRGDITLLEGVYATILHEATDEKNPEQPDTLIPQEG